MNLMWQEQRPLSRSDFIKLTPNPSWKPSSIHILLNSLLDKGAIQLEGFTRVSRNYARTFVPTLTEDEYAVMQITNRPSFKTSKIPSLMAGLLGQKPDPELIAELEEMLNQAKQEAKDNQGD